MLSNDVFLIITLIGILIFNVFRIHDLEKIEHLIKRIMLTWLTQTLHFKTHCQFQSAVYQILIYMYAK